MILPMLMTGTGRSNIITYRVTDWYQIHQAAPLSNVELNNSPRAKSRPKRPPTAAIEEVRFPQPKAANRLYSSKSISDNKQKRLLRWCSTSKN